MGGRPVTALNIVAFPSKKLDTDVLEGIVAGALNIITEAGAVLAGGHTIEDEEPKFGLAVTGLVHPDKIWTNSGARPGDVLILTKPIGSGVLFNANLKKLVSADALNECIATLVTLSKDAAKIFAQFEVHAATDITGFGLAGHGYEMAFGSRVTLEIDMDRVPIMTEALAMYEKGVSTGVNAPNRQMVEKSVCFKKTLPAWHQEIVFDPQTSGGLLVSVPAEQEASILKMLHENGIHKAECIGEVKPLENNTYLIFR
jgi:selenide, water dikinase